MPELLIHIAVPFLILTLIDVSFKRALPISLLGLLPDLDVLFGVHPSATHSLIVLIIPCALAALLVWKTYLDSKGLKLVGLSSLALLSHPVLDLFAGFRPLLWPLVNRSFYLEVSLSIPSFHLHPSTTLFPEFPPITELNLSALITPQGVVLSSILFASALAIWTFNAESWER